MLAVFVGAALVGLVIVVFQALWQRRLWTVLRNTALLAVNLFHVRELGTVHVATTGRNARGIDKPLPYAVPVLLATVTLVLCSVA